MDRLELRRVIEQLEEEMQRTGRERERTVLTEALAGLPVVREELLSVEQAAQDLGVPMAWIEERVQAGVLLSARCDGVLMVSKEWVQRSQRIQRALAELDQEGCPTEEELRELYGWKRTPDNQPGAVRRA